MPPEIDKYFEGTRALDANGAGGAEGVAERERTYRARVKTEVDTALRDSGLRLEGEKRDQFEQRYLQERRRIEHALRQETEAKRQEQLPALRDRLKKNFKNLRPQVHRHQRRRCPRRQKNRLAGY